MYNASMESLKRQNRVLVVLLVLVLSVFVLATLDSFERADKQDNRGTKKDLRGDVKVHRDHDRR